MNTAPDVDPPDVELPVYRQEEPISSTDIPRNQKSTSLDEKWVHFQVESSPSTADISANSSSTSQYELWPLKHNPKQLPDLERASKTPQPRLGWYGGDRPAKFSGFWAEFGFCFTMVTSQVVCEYFVSGFNVILPTVATDLSIPSASSTWPASAFSLVVSAFLLTFGRLADMFGGRIVYISGMAWLTVWSVVAGCSQNSLMLIICRALQGLGPSAFLPTSLMLLGSMYRPGQRKNIVFSIYAAMAPVGFYIGIFFAGVAGQYASWNWYFWIGAVLALITTVVAYFSIPSDYAERRELGVKMDWLGAFIIASGLICIVFAITNSSHASDGWRTPYVYLSLILGVLLLLIAFYVEGWVAEMPILPFDLFKVKYMPQLVLALFLTYGGMGIYFLYATFYMEDMMGGSPMQLVSWFTPSAIGGPTIAIIAALTLHMLPGTALIIFAGCAWICAPIFFLLAPEGANYWAFTFPAMTCATVGINITFNITNIFITTTLPKERQGLAGGLINSILQLGIAFFLGIANIIVSKTADQGERRAYKYAFCFELATAIAALAILVAFVKLGKAQSEMSEDEKATLIVGGEKVDGTTERKSLYASRS